MVRLVPGRGPAHESGGAPAPPRASWGGAGRSRPARAAERNEEAIARWVREEWPDIRNTLAGSLDRLRGRERSLADAGGPAHLAPGVRLRSSAIVPLGSGSRWPPPSPTAELRRRPDPCDCGHHIDGSRFNGHIAVWIPTHVSAAAPMRTRAGPRRRASSSVRRGGGTAPRRSATLEGRVAGRGPGSAARHRPSVDLA